MEIIGKFVCSSCEYTQVVDSQYIGKRFKCPNCHSPGIVKKIINNDGENLQEGQKSIKKAKFVCESCGYTKEVNAKYIGVKCKCSVCHNIGEIKEVTEEENKEESEKVEETKGKFICKSCGYTKEVDAKYIGIQCKCPECKNVGEIISVSDASLSHDTGNTNNKETNSVNISRESTLDGNYEQIDSENFSQNAKEDMLTKDQQTSELVPYSVKTSDTNSIAIVEGECKNNDIIDVQVNQNKYRNNQLIINLKNIYDKYILKLQNKIESTKNRIPDNVKDFYFKAIKNIKEFIYENIGSVSVICSIFLFICITLCIMNYKNAIEKRNIVITIVDYIDDNQLKILKSDIINEVNIYIDENRNIYKDVFSLIASMDIAKFALDNLGYNADKMINVYNDGIYRIINKYVENFYNELNYNNNILLTALENNKFDNLNIIINKLLMQDKKVDVNTAITDNLAGIGFELTVDIFNKLDTVTTIASIAGGPAGVGVKTAISVPIKKFAKEVIPYLFKTIKKYIIDKLKKSITADGVKEVVKDAAKDAVLEVGEMVAEEDDKIIKNSMKKIVRDTLTRKSGLFDNLNEIKINFHKERRKMILNNF